MNKFIRLTITVLLMMLFPSMPVWSVTLTVTDDAHIAATNAGKLESVNVSRALKDYCVLVL